MSSSATFQCQIDARIVLSKTQAEDLCGMISPLSVAFLEPHEGCYRQVRYFEIRALQKNIYDTGGSAVFDNFLTSVLQIVIALDILGVIAYFTLGGFKPKTHKKQVELVTVKAPSARKPLRERLTGRRPPPVADHVKSRGSELDTLKRILYSYQEGLT